MAAELRLPPPASVGSSADRAAVRAYRRNQRAERNPSAAVLLTRIEALEAALREIPDDERPAAVEFQFDRVLRAAQKLDRQLRGER